MRRGTFPAKRTAPDLSGAGGTLANPAALDKAAPLSNSAGSVLDPIISLRRTVTLRPQETAVIDFVIGVAAKPRGRAGAGGEISECPHGGSRLRSRLDPQPGDLRQLNATEAEAQLYAPAGRRDDLCRPGAARGARDIAGQPARAKRSLELMAFPATRRSSSARQRHRKNRARAATDPGALLLADEGAGGGSGHLERGRFGLPPIAAGPDHRPDRLRHRSADARQAGRHIRPADRTDSRTRIACCCRPSRGSCSTTKTAPWPNNWNSGSVLGSARAGPYADADRPDRCDSHPLPARDLIFHNGFGGFTRDGHEYVITLQPGQRHAGALGQCAGQSAIRNGHFRKRRRLHLGGERARISADPWNNDPVAGHARRGILHPRRSRPGNSGRPRPCRRADATPYVIRHGFGYTVFEHTEDGIASELWVYVATDAPVKLHAF